MTDQLVKANINLYAVLRNLEELCKMDEEVQELIKGENISICFNVSNGPKATLEFKDGRCTFYEEMRKSTIKLYFKNPQHLNDMFEGKANPIPLKGFSKISFLKNKFTQLTEKLAYYLKPTDELLKNPKYFKINAYLTAYTAFYALGEIGNGDKMGKANASRIPDGVIAIRVIDGPQVTIKVNKGVLEVSKESCDKPRAEMIFNSLEIASGILNGKIDTYTCIGSGQFIIRGFIPMLDNMNKLLTQIPAYLK